MNNTNQNQPQTNTLAIISLISGIVSFFLLPIIGGIAAIIIGSIARKQIRESGVTDSGDGLAKTGIILGWINIVLVALPVCVIVILALLGPAIGNVFSNIIFSI